METNREESHTILDEADGDCVQPLRRVIEMARLKNTDEEFLSKIVLTIFSLYNKGRLSLAEFHFH